MDIASLVIGIIAIILAFIPLCGAIAFLPALVGLALGLVDAVIKRRASESLGMSIAGIVLNSLAIIIIILWVFVFAVGSAV